MFGSQILDVLIGLVFVYLLLSLIITAINEVIAQAFNLRGGHLEKAIRQIVESDSGQGSIKLDMDRLNKCGLIKPLLRPWPIYKCPLFSRWPSYISAKTFSSALFDIVINQTGVKTEEGDTTADNSYSWSEEEAKQLARIIRRIPNSVPAVKGSIEVLLRYGEVKPKGLQGNTRHTFNQFYSAVEGLDNSSLKTVLQTTLNTAKAEAKDWDEALIQARSDFEQWFDDYMDRVSGWYKRRIQMFTLIFALVISFLFNVDTIAIGQALYRDNNLRTAVTNGAIKFVEQESEQSEDGDSFTIDELQSELHDLGLPIGWIRELEKRDDESPQQSEQRVAQAKLDNRFLIPSSNTQRTTKIFGLLFTVLAVSLGAPLWFDVLSKLANIRATGKSPGNNTKAGTKPEILGLHNYSL